MTFLKKHQLFSLLFLGFFLRLSLIFLDYSFDVNNHISWAHDLWMRGFTGFFDKQSTEVYATIYPNYPPAALFIFYLFYPIGKFIFSIFWWLNINLPLFPSNLVLFVEKKFFLAGMLKLPAIFADLGTAWLCYLFAKKISPKAKRLQLLIASLILFNPAFFYNSSYWGQIDIIPIFFVLASYYFLIYSKRHILSGILFTLALLVKPTAFVYFPIYIIFFINKNGFANFLKTLLIGNIIFIISFIPFLDKFSLTAPYIIYSEKILAAQSLPYASNGAFNFWLLITQFAPIKDTAPFILDISYRVWGFIGAGLFFILIIYKYKKSIFMASFLAAFASFLFLTKMHERYLILSLPFLLLRAVKDKRLLKWFYLLSLLSFANLYHSWPVPHNNFFVKLSQSSFAYNSVILILIVSFFFLLFRWPVKREQVVNTRSKNKITEG